MTDNDPWLTEREAAIELRVSPGTVRKERMEGALGFARVRGRVFYPMSCIKAYKAAQIEPAGALCETTTSSGEKTSPAGDGTSHGQRKAGAGAYQQVQRIMQKLSKSSASSH